MIALQRAQQPVGGSLLAIRASVFDQRRASALLQEHHITLTRTHLHAETPQLRLDAYAVTRTFHARG